MGSVSKVKWINQGGHPYTGLFKGGDAGFARFSTGGPVGATGIAPALAVKLLRNGEDSGNFVAMESLDSQDGFDFF